MPVRLNSSGGGSVTLDVPSTASAFNLTLPAANGNLGINLGTAQNSTSGTSIDFTGIPAGVRRVTVMFNGVSTNGSSVHLLQVGTSAGIVSSGYVAGAIGSSGGAGGGSTFTTGFGTSDFGGAANALSGHFVLTQQSGNNWVASFMLYRANGANLGFGAGHISLSGTLDRVRITTVNGTDTFDAGSINIAWEF